MSILIFAHLLFEFLLSQCFMLYELVQLHLLLIQLEDYFLQVVDCYMQLPYFIQVFVIELGVLVPILNLHISLKFLHVVIELKLYWDLPYFEHALHSSLRDRLNFIHGFVLVDVAHHIHLHHEAILLCLYFAMDALLFGLV